MEETNRSLYQRALGDVVFDGLCPVLRKFHDVADGAAASGTLRITRGNGWLRQTVAALMRLPPPGEQVPVWLHVRTENDAEIWTRRFGEAASPVSLVTRQWLQDNLLFEAAGPLRFHFRLAGDGAGGMRFTWARTGLFGLPLPGFVAPRVEAHVEGLEDGWRVSVRVTVPLLGLLTHYVGTVTPQ